MKTSTPDTMSTAQPSSRLTTTEFRKVELQSPADMAYLVAQTQRAARSKIDVAFPPSAAPTNGEDDGMRRRVEELVQQFVERTWEGVRRNASCNGMDMAGNGSSANGQEDGAAAEEFFEPLDAKLAERIRLLEAEKERLTLKVTGLRRDAPATAAERFKQRWTDSEVASAKQMEEAAAETEQMDLDLDLGDFKRWDEVRAVYEQGTDGLMRLKTDMTETVARLERAKGVAAYVEAQRR